MLTPHDLATIDPSTLRGVARCECGNCGAWDSLIHATHWGVCEVDMKQVTSRVKRWGVTHSHRDTCPAWRGEP